MIESRPSSSVLTLPETGASSSSAPAPRASSASARLAAGDPVVMSTQTLPGRRPARIPSGPSATASSARAFVTMVKTTSAASAVSRGVPRSTSPASTSACAFSGVRL